MSDLISRRAAIDAVSEACSEWRGIFGRCEDALKTLPTVDVEPLRHGEWIRDTDHHWDSKYKCSRCEYETDVDTCFGKPLYNYCPYCGAKMDGEMHDDA